MCRRLFRFPQICLVIFFCLTVWVRPVTAQTTPVLVLDAPNDPLSTLVDGNSIRLKVSLPKAVSNNRSVDFVLDGVAAPVANCIISAGQSSCQTSIFSTLGWAWNGAGERQYQRVVKAQSAGTTLGESAPLTITPRPVVMVHGLTGSWSTWSSYLGENGFLAAIGLHGYAVGDGQAPGVMNTGDSAQPTVATYSIAQNAEILGTYIDNVQQVTDAEQVDVIVHSMGGIITRYYLDRVTKTRNVAQLIILGSPMGGSSCSVLPAALGLLLPASLELQPSYMQAVFNPQITRRQGVPFHAMAGTKLLTPVESPCTDAPSDIAVSIASAQAISMPVQEVALLHHDLKADPTVFNDFVRPLLQTPPGNFWQGSDPPLPAPTAPLQFTRVYTGHLQPGETHSVTIHIDPGVTLATFALYDTSFSLTTQVTGASGKTLQLDPVANGVISVTNPATLVYLGYGFVQPKAGKWVVAVQTTDETPANGADYAIAAQFTGGAALQATLDKLTPKVNDLVNLQMQMLAAGQAITLTSAQARVRQPDGQLVTYPLQLQVDNPTLTLTPSQSGLYGVELNVSAQTEAGEMVDRAAFIVFEAQPTALEIRQTRLLTGITVALVLAAVMSGSTYWRRAATRNYRRRFTLQ